LNQTLEVMMKDSLLFLGQMARRWRDTGAIFPSGPGLSRAMVNAVGEVPENQVILELGPGTGVFSRDLVKRFPRSRIIAIEVNDQFAARLESSVPDITVVLGCASRLSEHMNKLGIAPQNIAAVVSGLPLLSLPGDLPQRILASVASVLLPGRRFVQFTYSQKAWNRFDVAGFQRDPSRRIWWNVPPAFVLPFTRHE
jgi:phosphatidylethanolamine/phosphatidyl-N-methylethanolamine N-methyltransferase